MYEEELTALAEAGVRFLVIGGVALGLSGYLRATWDLDIMPDLGPENLERLITALEKLGYRPKAPVDPRELKDPKKRAVWLTEKNMKVFSFYNTKNPVDTVDIMIYHPIDFERCHERAEKVMIGDRKVRVASIEDLLSMKRISGREKDKEDIRILEELLESL